MALTWDEGSGFFYHLASFGVGAGVAAVGVGVVATRPHIGIALIEYETPLNEYSSLRAERLIIAVVNRNYSVNSGNSGQKRDEHKSIEYNESFLCPYGQKSNNNLFYNLRLYEPEIFQSRQAPKIVLMIFYDFCSEGA